MGANKFELPLGATFLVTGSAGFIGSNLVEAILELGYKVRGLDNLSTGQRKNIDAFISHPNYDFIEGDICDYDTCENACKDVDFVLHQAAWGSVPRSIEIPLIYEKVNIGGTLNMLEAARRNKVKKFVYASSSSVYGDAQNMPKREGQEGQILSPYALTKKVNEEYAKLYKELYDLDTYGLRYFNVFGRRQDPNGEYAAVIPRFIKLLLNNEKPTIYGDGNQTRDFTYIENVINANLHACIAPSDAAGEAYNIAFGESIKLIDVYHLLCNIFNKNIEPQFTGERIGDIKHSKADITKAVSRINYQPEWSFHKGIQHAIDWYSENLDN